MHAMAMNTLVENPNARQACTDASVVESAAARRCALDFSRGLYVVQAENVRLRALLEQIARRASAAQHRSIEPFAQMALGDIAARASDPD